MIAFTKEYIWSTFYLTLICIDVKLFHILAVMSVTKFFTVPFLIDLGGLGNIW